MGKKTQIDALTGLRGVGALWVFLFHFFEGYHLPLIEHGHLAVPMFFMLSGFILFYVHGVDFEKGLSISKYVQFLKLRLARIYPVHLACLCLTAALISWLPEMLGRYSTDRFSWANLIPNLFLVQTWGLGRWSIFSGASDSWNAPAWSLSAEWFYYLLFPVIAVGVEMVKRPLARITFFVLLMAVVVFLYQWLLPVGAKTFTRELAAGLGAFVLGVVFCAHVHTADWRDRFVVWGYGGVLPIALYFTMPNVGDGVFLLGVTLLFFPLLKAEDWLSALLSGRIFLFLGRISFSLYMIHWPLVQVYNYFGENLKWPTTGIIHLYEAIFVISVLFCAFVFYRFLELPSRRYVVNNWLK